MTDRYGVIGHPIGHSRSPLIHRSFAAQTGEDLSYEAFDIPPEELEARLRALIAADLRGCNVTVPHKQAIARLVDQLSDRARLAGAVNTVTVKADGTLHGDNTDGVGLLTDLTVNLHVPLEGARVLILGAGGATRGIVPVLLGANPKQILIANRTIERAQELVVLFAHLGAVTACGFDALESKSRDQGFDEKSGGGFDLVINATSAGLKGKLPPFPPSIIGVTTTCYDLSYAATDTPFIAWARRHHAARVHDGWGMLVEQAAESFFIWRGVRPETVGLRTERLR